MDVPDTLKFLAGTWDLRRSIVDHRSGTRGSFSGLATVEMDREPRQASYLETGRMSFADHCGPANRRLRFVGSAGSGVEVYFADGRPFVDLDLRTGSWRSRHPCGDDVYEIVTTVHSATEVEERWSVRGPTKSYDAVTILSRRPG